mgnify:FL=1
MRRFSRLAVLLGGVSGEREVSLQSGQRVVASLKRQGYQVVEIDPIDEDWLDQLRTTAAEGVFLALHGKGYEDGTVQAILESLGLPYTGSGILASALGMNKIMAKRVFQTMEIPTPAYMPINLELDLDQQCEEAIEQIGFPLVVKPTSEGSSLGVSIVYQAEKLRRAVEKNRDFQENMFEQYIQGKEITVGLIGIGSQLRTLPVLELIPQNKFYDYEAKYTEGMTQFIIPARLSETVSQIAQSVALRAHLALGCHGYSRVDMIINETEQPFVTEVNTLPGLTELSDLPAQAGAAGISYDQLIAEILEST